MFELLGQHYSAFLNIYSKPSTYLNYEVNSEPDEYGSSYQIYGNWFEKYNNYNNKTIEEIVAEQLELYNNSI